MNSLHVAKYCLLIKKKKKIEQAKFTYSPLEKSFEKQTKITEDHVKVLKSLESSEKRLASIKDYISKEDYILKLLMRKKELKKKKES